MNFQGILNAIADLFLARTKGYREQAGRQDREARAPIAEILRTWQKRLQHEEARRTAIQRNDGGLAAEEDLRMIDCVGFAWQILDGTGNPLLNPRAAARVEHNLKGLIGADYVDFLKARLKEPQRPRSMNDMHTWMRELATLGVGYSMGSRKPTPIEKMFDRDPDPTPVTHVRHRVERLIEEVLR